MASDHASTSWTLVQEAAGGVQAARARFAERYAPVVRATLAARWARSGLAAEIDDAVQDVLLDCLREGGALSRAAPHAGAGFRAFLRGVARNVALRRERTHATARERADGSLIARAPDSGPEDALDRAFDREWARALVREAAERMRTWAEDRGEAARLRVTILELRFGSGLPTREIATRLGRPAKQVQKSYELARREFEAMLRQVVVAHDPGSEDHLEAECRALLAALAED